MSDCMNFSDNWRTFLNDYSFKDTNEIYTNGAILIPTFRVEQLIEHYFSARPKAKWIFSCYQDEEANVNGCYQYECSNCGYGETFVKNFHVPYCWHCGAKMDE